MTTCSICERIKNKKNVLLQGKHVAVLLPDTPAGPGHVWITPVYHAPIIEQIPDAVVSEMFEVANIVSVQFFEVFGATGTNMFIENGIPAGQKHTHTLLHVLARKENDAIKLSWTPKNLNDEEMATVELRLREQEEMAEEPAGDSAENQEDYLAQALKRIP